MVDERDESDALGRDQNGEPGNEIQSIPTDFFSPTDEEEPTSKPSPYIPKDIWEASRLGNTAAVKAFIKKDPFLSIYPSENDRTPLYLAAHGGHLETCKVLLENGATDKDGECYRSALNGNIRKLLKARDLTSNPSQNQVLQAKSTESINQKQFEDDYCGRIFCAVFRL